MRSLLLITSLLASSAQVSGFVLPDLAFKLATNRCSSKGNCYMYRNQRQQQARGTTTRVFAPLSAASAADADADASNASRLEKRLLDDFRVAGGEVVNPYRVLNVSRNAQRADIKAAYRSLSRKYHPDGILQRNDGILPGRCNSMDDVREEWERIKLSYEILTDRKMRVRYDRNSALANPGAAVGRAALGTIGWGLSGVGKGLVEVGKMALNQGKSK
jgi:hypothetical protein